MRNFYIETQNVNEICDEYENPGRIYLETALTQMPAAYAELTGNPGTGEISGMVRFYPVGAGVLVNAEVYGLPVNPNPCGFDIFGFHIHEGLYLDLAGLIKAVGVHKVMRFLPPVVTGPIIILIGLSLATS